MSIVNINTFPDTPLYSMRVVLDGREYILHFDYNGKEDRFYLAVHSSADEALAKGIKIVCGVPLLRKFVDARLPPGQLVAVSLVANDDSPPGLGELGTARRVKLVYADDEEIIAATT